jgi:hypothetical protein
LKNTLAKRPDLADTSSGKTAWKGDALNTILGADKPGRVHGLGLVPNPNQVFDVSSSRHFQDMHLTSLEDTRNEDLLSIRLQLEKVEQHMKNQDAKILEISEKTVSSERQSSERQVEFKELFHCSIHVLIFLLVIIGWSDIYISRCFWCCPDKLKKKSMYP